ncbi:MAG: hypothetical protein ACXWID_18410 [Pyrinomonadaceae bacterium]
MTFDNREVENTLLNKFAFVAAKKARDHRWLELTLPDLPAILTKFSHTREDISDALWSKIARQLRVNANYLSGMIVCTNSRDDYYKKVRTEPNPPWSHLMRGTAQRKPSHQPMQKPRPRRKK